MKRIKKIVAILAVVVLFICIYSFLLGNEVFKGRFSNDGIGWYFLAKGIFCSMALYLLVRILEALKNKKSQSENQ